MDPSDSAPVFRASRCVDDAEITAGRAFADGAGPRPFQVFMQMTVLGVVAVAKSGVELQTIVSLTHGVIRAGDDIKAGHRRIVGLRHSVFEACLRAEIPKGVPDHTCWIAVV